MKSIPWALLLIFYSSSSFGFNYRKCTQFMARWGYPSSLTSATQWTSSTGACSAMASRTEEKKRFFVINYEKFQNEAAQGRGEHLYTFGLLSGCSLTKQSEFNVLLKKNYQSIFSRDYRARSFRQINDLALVVCGES